jgi:hypothetical protein
LQCREDEEQKEIRKQENFTNFLKKGVEKLGGRLLTLQERFPWLYKKTSKKRN